MTDNQYKANKYLSAIMQQEQKIKALKREREALEYAASGQGAIRYDIDRVQTTPSNDKMIIFVEDLINKKAEIKELESSLEEQKTTAYGIIRQIQDADERTILEWYYINALPMDEIKIKFSMSERKVYYLKEDALENFGLLL